MEVEWASTTAAQTFRDHDELSDERAQLLENTHCMCISIVCTKPRTHHTNQPCACMPWQSRNVIAMSGDFRKNERRKVLNNSTTRYKNEAGRVETPEVSLGRNNELQRVQTRIKSVFFQWCHCFNCAKQLCEKSLLANFGRRFDGVPLNARQIRLNRQVGQTPTHFVSKVTTKSSAMRIF